MSYTVNENDKKVMDENKEYIENIYPKMNSFLDKSSNDSKNFVKNYNLPTNMQFFQEIEKTSLRKSRIIISSKDRNLFSDELFSFRVRLYPEPHNNNNSPDTIGIHTNKKFKSIYSIRICNLTMPKYKFLNNATYTNLESGGIRSFPLNKTEIIKITLDNASKSDLMDGSSNELRKVFQYLVKETESDTTITYVNSSSYQYDQYQNKKNPMFCTYNAFQLSFKNQIFTDYFGTIETFTSHQNVFDKIFLPFFRFDFHEEIENIQNEEEKHRANEDIQQFFTTNNIFDPRLHYFDIYIIRTIDFYPYKAKFQVELDVSYPYNYVSIGDAILFRNCHLHAVKQKDHTTNLNDIFSGVNDMIFGTTINSDSSLRFFVSALYNESMQDISDENNLETLSDQRIHYIDLQFPPSISNATSGVYNFRKLVFGGDSTTQNISDTKMTILENNHLFNSTCVMPAALQNVPFLFNLSLQYETIVEVTEEEEFYLKNHAYHNYNTEDKIKN